MIEVNGADAQERRFLETLSFLHFCNDWGASMVTESLACKEIRFIASRAQTCADDIKKFVTAGEQGRLLSHRQDTD